MGGGLTAAGAMNACDGQDVLAELDRVFLDPTSPAYAYAKQNNTFDTVKNEPDNYRALISAYVEAGVDVYGPWGAYLRKLSRSPQGQQDIHKIAQTRFKALRRDVPMQTTTHGVDDVTHGGGHVSEHEGSGAHDPSTINSPYPLP